MTTKRPPSQLTLDLPMPGRGEASRQLAREVEVVTATTEPESPASTKHLMEAICDPDNIEAALRTVVRNKGAPGVDGMTVRQLPGILKARWLEIEHQLLQGRYQPQPVRRVQIPKPAGGTRDLGIPTVIDRVIQQAVLQRLKLAAARLRYDRFSVRQCRSWPEGRWRGSCPRRTGRVCRPVRPPASILPAARRLGADRICRIRLR